MLQVHLSGGEPTLRRDLEQLVAGLSARGVYTNLITAGVGIAEGRIEAFAEAGLDHLQLSFQGARPATTERIGNHRGSHEKKLETARRARAAGLPLTINAPIHRHNIEEVPEFIELALSLGAERLEIANVQYAGWALVNRDALMPDRAAVDRQAEIVEAARERLAGIMNIDFVTPDYFAIYPKPCMGGWARDAFMVAPDGTVLPCHAAQTIPSLTLRAFRRPHAGRDLDRFAGLQCLPRHRLDAGAVPQLRAARDRLGRLPLPGDGDCRRRRRDRPGLREIADPCAHGHVDREAAASAGRRANGAESFVYRRIGVAPQPSLTRAAHLSGRILALEHRVGEGQRVPVDRRHCAREKCRRPSAAG